MGVHENIGFSRFPQQGSWVGMRTQVCFDYDTANTILGTLVREDVEEPGIAIIRLDDGRHVLTTECQHSPIRSSQETKS